LESLITSGKITVVSSGGDSTDLTASFLNLLQTTTHPKDGSSPEHQGAVLRWAVEVNKEEELTLRLQALPLAATAVAANPLLNLDSCPSRTLAEFWLRSVVEEQGGGARGPLPILFARDPQLARRNIRTNPDFVLPGWSPFLSITGLHMDMRRLIFIFYL
jgi:hypothetical protein